MENLNLVQQPLTSNESATPTATSTTYQPPQVTDLGAWTQLTLIYSVPFNAGNALNPFGEQQ